MESTTVVHLEWDHILRMQSLQPVKEKTDGCVLLVYEINTTIRKFNMSNK